MNVQKAPAGGGNPSEPQLTREEVEQALPVNLRGSHMQALTDRLNTISADPEAAKSIRENFVGYASILKDGRFKVDDYVNAVVYVSWKLLNKSNVEAWQRTFPKRHAELVARGTSPKDFSAYAASYHRNKLVNLIMEQVLVPSWILNQDVYQQAINIALDIALNSKNDMARASATNTLMTHLKKPETVKTEIDINVHTRDPIADLEDMLKRVAETSRRAIHEGGISAKQIAETKLIESQPVVDAEFSEVEDGE